MRTINRKGWLTIAGLALAGLAGAWALQAAADRREAELDAATAAIVADPQQAAATSRWNSENRKAL